MRNNQFLQDQKFRIRKRLENYKKSYRIERQRIKRQKSKNFKRDRRTILQIVSIDDMD